MGLNAFDAGLKRAAEFLNGTATDYDQMGDQINDQLKTEENRPRGFGLMYRALQAKQRGYYDTARVLRGQAIHILKIFSKENDAIP